MTKESYLLSNVIERKKLSTMWVIVFCLVALSGCGTQPTVLSRTEPEGEPVATSATRLICIIQPEDAGFVGAKEIGSGKDIAEAIQAAVQRIGRESVVVNSKSSNRIELCKQRGAEIVLVTDILDYEDNVTGWSGNPDRIELKITAQNISQPQKTRSFTYEAESNVLYSANFEWGNAKPASLLQDNFARLLRKLLRP